MLIYKICHAGEWGDAVKAGRYAGSMKDRADGFLHFSTAAQIVGTLEKYYANETGLLLVAIEADALGEALKWEPSRNGALFPHLYAPLPLEAVTWTGAIGRSRDGGFVLPAAAQD